MNANEPDCSPGGDDDLDLSTSHGHAMVAKQAVFKAQDFAQRLGKEKLRDRAMSLLWRARAALEELDNVFTDEQQRRAGR